MVSAPWPPIEWPDIAVRAFLSDDNLPVVPEGNTEELRDIDKVLVEADGMIIHKGQPIFKITPDERPVYESPEEIAARRREATNQFLQQLQ